MTTSPNSVMEVDNGYRDAGSGPASVLSYPYAANSLIVNRNANVLGTITSVTDFVVTSGGNVGVGTATPQSALDVNGGIAVGTYAGATAAPSSGMIVSGSVGIGTSSPGAILDVNAAGVGAYGYGILSRVSDNNAKGLCVNNSGDKFVVYGDGHTVIGGMAPSSSTYTPYLLAVDGNIVAQKVLVETSDWSDRVFDESYPLKSLSEIETYVHQNKHLPDVLSECDAIEKGIDVGEMNKVLLQKVEELTLYLIQQQKEIDALKNK